MRSLCDISTVIKPSPLIGCSDNFVSSKKSLTLTRVELMIIKEQSAIYGCGFLFKDGVVTKVNLPENISL